MILYLPYNISYNQDYNVSYNNDLLGTLPPVIFAWGNAR